MVSAPSVPVRLPGSRLASAPSPSPLGPIHFTPNKGCAFPSERQCVSHKYPQPLSVSIRPAGSLRRLHHPAYYPCSHPATLDVPPGFRPPGPCSSSFPTRGLAHAVPTASPLRSQATCQRHLLLNAAALACRWFRPVVRKIPGAETNLVSFPLLLKQSSSHDISAVSTASRPVVLKLIKCRASRTCLNNNTLCYHRIITRPDYQHSCVAPSYLNTLFLSLDIRIAPCCPPYHIPFFQPLSRLFLFKHTQPSCNWISSSRSANAQACPFQVFSSDSRRFRHKGERPTAYAFGVLLSEIVSPPPSGVRRMRQPRTR